MARSPRAARFTCISSVAVLVAAGVAWQARAHQETGELSYRTVSLGPIAFPTPTVRVFRSNRERRRYVSQAEPGRTAPALPFARGSAYVLVTTGPRSSGGYSIDVERVAEERARVVFHAVERTPRLGGHAAPGVTSPYRLLALRGLDKPVVVDWRGR